MIRQWFPVTLSRPELDLVLRALDEISVYDLSEEDDEVKDELVPRLEEARDRGAVREFMDSLNNGTPQDILDALED
jgi:hypothetical protein